MVGGAVSGWSLALLKFQGCEISWAKLLSLVIVWGMSAWLGVKVRLVLSLFGVIKAGARGSPSWSGVLWCVCFTSGLFFYTLGPIECWDKFLSALAFSLSLCFIFSKIGCIIKGCCGISKSFKSKISLNLPKLEIGFTVLVLFFQTLFLIRGDEFLSAVVFFVSHTLLRLASYYLRGQLNFPSNYLNVAKAASPLMIFIAMGHFA